jgi:hypothetical protein
MAMAALLTQKHVPPLHSICRQKLTITFMLAVAFWIVSAIGIAWADGPLQEQKKSGAAKGEEAADPSVETVLNLKPLPVEKLSALPRDAKTVAYTDPRKRFTWQHDADWKIMPNWIGGAELFCQWPECRASALSRCSLNMANTENISQKDIEAITSLKQSALPPDGIDLGLMGVVRFLQGGTVLDIDGMRWAKSGAGMKLFNAIPLETTEWVMISGGRIHHLSCEADPKIMRKIEPKIKQLLRGFVLTKP